MQSIAFYWPIHYAVVLLSGFDAGRAQRAKLFANPIKEPFSFDNGFESVVLPRYMSQLRNEITRYCDDCVFGNGDWKGGSKCVTRGSRCRLRCVLSHYLALQAKENYESNILRFQGLQNLEKLL